MLRKLNFFIFLFIALLSLSALTIIRYLEVSGVFPTFLTYSDIYALEKKVRIPLPFIKKNIEYPILTAIFIELMGILGKSKESYFLFNAFFLILAYVLASFLLYKIIPKKDRKKLLIFWTITPSSILFTVYNWDILGILFTLFSFYLFERKKDILASLFLLLGVCVKIFPVIFLFPILFKRKFKEKIKIILTFLFGFLLLNIYFILTDFQSWLYPYLFQISREPNIDSFWGIISSIFSINPVVINLLSLFSFLLVYCLTLWKFRKKSYIEICFLAFLTFLIFGKIFSPQYILWLLPFFVLSSYSNKNLFYLLEASNAIVFFSVMIWYFSFQANFIFWILLGSVLLRHLALIKICSNLFSFKINFREKV
jgi:uncharacterized membrane protein